jgi:hypothetical protein
VKLSTPHWVIVVLVILGTVAPPIGVEYPSLSPITKLISQLDPIILGALGVTAASAITSTNVMAAVRAGAVRVGGALSALALVFFLPGCSASATKTDVATSIDLTNAICSVAPDSPVGQPYVELVCAIAQGVEQTVSIVVNAVDGSDAGATTATMSVPVETIRIRIPAPQAAAFLKAHASYAAHTDGGH